MLDIGKMNIRDSISGDAIYIFVRIDQNNINIVLSEEHGGDVDFRINVSDCKELVQRLEEAVGKVSG